METYDQNQTYPLCADYKRFKVLGLVSIAPERLLLGRRPNRRPRHKKEYDIKSDFKETGWDDVAEFI
jgi:hypothetical protein